MTGIKTILFDLDGTLIDTTDLILGCFDHAWQGLYGIAHSRESLLATFGMPLREAMHRLLRDVRPAAEAGTAAVEVSVTTVSSETEQVEHLLTSYRAFNVANHDTIARP